MASICASSSAVAAVARQDSLSLPLSLSLAVPAERFILFEFLFCDQREIYPVRLPGDFGFDPLGLGSDPESLRWNQQAELVHCRWAMLGAAGIFIPELLTKLGILNTPSWYTAGEQEYFTDTTTLFVVELVLIGWAEGRRWADIIKPGSVNTDPIFPNNKLTGTDVGYPGGLWFDPLGWGSGSRRRSRS
ncbi:unnamed protein product [Spirodela intermedia]|uniref:Chlorophyll a-b binding protein, chloroplastic n=1 Tax=Spirodela intermedia TaxID=51605 RepID=A0A7I8IQ63_SPIIN|nr:unnamed protein product [Spirodela intermedia]CAA6659932.1 unnamed protein product [Spirodela intermedia]